MTVKSDMAALTAEVQRTRAVRSDLQNQLQTIREALDAATVAEDNATDALLTYVLSYSAT